MRCVVNPFRKHNSCPDEAFGSSHQVYSTLQPQRGYCRGTLVPCGELCQPSSSMESGVSGKEPHSRPQKLVQ